MATQIESCPVLEYNDDRASTHSLDRIARIDRITDDELTLYAIDACGNDASGMAL